MTRSVLRRSLWLLLAAGWVGCSHPNPAAPSALSSVPDASAPAASTASAPADSAAPQASASASAPQAAAAPECRVAEDCRITFLPPQGCCRTSCAARAVPTRTFEAEEKARAGCDASACVQVLCRPESASVRAACEAGRCVVRRDAHLRD